MDWSAQIQQLAPDPALPSRDYRMLSPLSAEEGNQEASQATGSLLFQSVPPQPPRKDHPVMCLIATFSSMQTEAFKVILWLIFLKASVSSGFWRAKWLKKFSPGAHCEMPRGVRFCFAFQAQMPLPEWLNRIILFQLWEHWSGDRRAQSPTFRRVLIFTRLQQNTTNQNALRKPQLYSRPTKLSVSFWCLLSQEACKALPRAGQHSSVRVNEAGSW